MSRMRWLVGVVCVAATLTGACASTAATVDPTRGAEGYTYFNKPRSTAAAYDDDLGRCIARGVAAFPDGQLTKRGEVRASNASVYGGLVAGGLANMAYQAKLNTNLQNCMTIAGWRVMRLNEATGAALWARSPAEIGQELATWTGAADPPGTVVRSYENDLARRGTVLFVIRPFPSTGMRSLSLKAFESSRLEVHRSHDPERFAGEGSKFSARPLDLATATGVSASEAIVVWSWSGKPASKYDFLIFRRFGPSVDVNAFATDGKPDEFQLLGDRATAVDGERRVYARTLPAGRWRLMYRGGLETCLGAPAFEARAGEVLYLGHFDLDSDMLTPNLTLDPARPPVPSPLAAKMAPATWKNGAQWPCHFLFNHFALEFPALPAEPPPGSGGAAR